MVRNSSWSGALGHLSQVTTLKGNKFNDEFRRVREYNWSPGDDSFRVRSSDYLSGNLLDYPADYLQIVWCRPSASDLFIRQIR